VIHRLLTVLFCERSEAKGRRSKLENARKKDPCRHCGAMSISNFFIAHMNRRSAQQPKTEPAGSLFEEGNSFVHFISLLCCNLFLLLNNACVLKETLMQFEHGVVELIIFQDEGDVDFGSSLAHHFDLYSPPCKHLEDGT